MTKSRFSTLILAWYDRHKRALPWREDNNPYAIWLSEIILQQTRVAQGLPYYTRFIEKYPTVQALAAAPEDEVLRLWQGLGYYSRARNLHKCAKLVTNKYSGNFPKSMAELKTLPGIGNYTAAAISSVAFGEALPVVDGNVYRLLARYFGVSTDISSSPAYREFFELALTLIDDNRPGDFNQAMMEFGAVQCVPRQPACESCPLQDGCFAFEKNTQQELPVKRKKTKVRQRYFNYFLIQVGERLLFRQRQEKDIWQGLYEPPLFESPAQISVDEVKLPILEQLTNKNIVFEVDDKIHRHVLSHQILHVSFVVINIEKTAVKDLVLDHHNWYNFAEAEDLPKPVLIANYLDSYLNSIHLQEEKN